MIKTFGKLPTTPPRGFFKAIHFPQLCLMDSETGDGRLLEGLGAGSRNLPLSIRNQFDSLPGHNMARITGTLHTITFDDETGIVSGDGFLLNDENGRKHAALIALGAQRGNSVDLADCDIVIKWKSDDPASPDFWEYTITFTKWNIAATTGVGTPAFADARGGVDLTDAELDEIMASMGNCPMEPLVETYTHHELNILVPKPEISRVEVDELVAAGMVQRWEAFFHPESPTEQSITIFEDRTFCGHLGLWNTCHDGVEGQCIIIPRPPDSYASFNKSHVLTDRGLVETGPIFAYGGHRKLGGKDPADAYGGIENAWGDCRITPGLLGPWVSGVVRPGVSEKTIYDARASRISGHWKGERLKAIVSVNSEAFEVAGSGEDPLERMILAGFGAHIDDSGVSELVASFPRCKDATDPLADYTVKPFAMSVADRDAIAAKVLASLTGKDGLISFTTSITETTTTEVIEAAVDEVLVNAGPTADDLMLADLLADDD